MIPSTVMANSISDDDDDSFTKPLGRRSVTYYGMGHMLNDITAACWFTYLLLFLSDIGLSPRCISYYLVSRLYNHITVVVYIFSLKFPSHYVEKERYMKGM